MTLVCQGYSEKQKVQRNKKLNFIPDKLYNRKYNLVTVVYAARSFPAVHDPQMDACHSHTIYIVHGNVKHPGEQRATGITELHTPQLQ